MNGYVDDKARALFEVFVCSEPNGDFSPVTAWIDTAFDGHLVFSKALIGDLELVSLIETEAILADGSKVILETFLCYLDWFGQRVPLQVIANEGKFPLLGTALLDERVLHVDYLQRTVALL